MSGLVHVDRLPVDVVCSPQGEMQHSATNRVVGNAIDHDEAAGVPVVRVPVIRNRAIEIEVAHPDLVESERFCRYVFKRVHIDLVLGVSDGQADRECADLHQVRTPREHLLIVHPDDVSFELVGHRRRSLRAGQQVTTTDVDLVFQRHGDRLSRHSLVKVPVGGNDAAHGALTPRGSQSYWVTRMQHPAHDGAGESTEARIGAVHPLDRHAKWAVASIAIEIDRLENSDQRRARVPGGVAAAPGDVVAPEGGDRNAHHVGDADLFRKLSVLGVDQVKRLA